MKPLFTWEQFGFKFDIYEAGKLILYVDDDILDESSLRVEKNLMGFNLSFFDGLLSKDQIEEIRSTIEKYKFKYLHGATSLWDSMVDAGLSEPQILKYYPKLERIMYQYEYSGNPRIACIGDETQEREYRRQQKLGCCGFYDETITIDGLDYYFGFYDETITIDGLDYYFGFNYGH